jgi:hypothetical protein
MIINFKTYSYVSRDTIETYIRSVHGRRIEYQIKALKAGQEKWPQETSWYTAKGDQKVYIDDCPASKPMRDVPSVRLQGYAHDPVNQPYYHWKLPGRLVGLR